MNLETLNSALDALGNTLTDRITITVAGSAMLLLSGRITRDVHDCDLMRIEPVGLENVLLSVAADIGNSLGLGQNWLNAQMCAWEKEFPEGWNCRREPFRTFGNLTVEFISQVDGIALKAFAMVTRTDQQKGLRDLGDIEMIVPNAEELAAALRYLDRMDQEGYGCIPARAILQKMQRT